LRELAVIFAARALEATEHVDHDEALARAERALDTGEALERFRRMVEAQGGDPHVVDDPEAVLPRAPVVLPIPADRGGTLAAVDAEAIGSASVALGAGRLRKGDPVDPAVGLVVRCKIGDRLTLGESIGDVHARTTEDAAEATRRVLGAFTLADHDVPQPPLVHRWIDDGPRS
jgi:thymidine phosphorylase